MFLSVVVPLFNESERLGKGLIAISKYLKKKKFTSEIIVVNDGSTDDTGVQLKKLSGTVSFRKIELKQNHGKGYAVKTGLLAASGTYRLFTDIDLSTPIETVDAFLPYLGKYDIIIGSRRLKNSNVLVHQSATRETLGHAFTLLSRFILATPVSDFTCGFKCYSAKAVSGIFPDLVIERWGFDSEALFLAVRKGYAVKEVPVTWRNDVKTKVKFPGDLLRSLADLARIRFHTYS